MSMDELKKRISEIMPDADELPMDVLEKVAGGLSEDSSGEALISALASNGVDTSRLALKLGVAKPDQGGLSGATSSK